jgi:dipeptidyl aminopeptidase/acylaminoacyl peptidase
MKRDPLGEALREAPIPVPAAAEERGRRVVEAAFAQGQGGEPSGPESRLPSLPRLALGLALATLLAALLLSPAGADVRDWVDDAFTASAPHPEPTLAEIPGGGRLLVQSPGGPWVVQPDGSRRLLGDYEEAAWSPHGLFVAAVKGRTLSALEPDGTPRWSITASREIGGPRWSPSGERIAYRAGFGLRVIAGDGTEDRLLAGSTASTAPAYVAPSWSPLGNDALAYVSGAHKLRIVDGETGEELATAPALHRITWMEWGAGGRAILEASPEALRLRSVRAPKLSPGPTLGAGRRLPLAAGLSVVDAALAPRRLAVAAVLTRWRKSGTRSSIVLFGPGGGKPRRLLTVPGSLGQVAWSPDGRRLLVAWPPADQWLFLPAGKGQGRAVANVSTAFAPGQQSASFPRVEGWCCP